MSQPFPVMYTAGLLYYVYSMPTNVYCSHTVLCVQQTNIIMCIACVMYCVKNMPTVLCLQQTSNFMFTASILYYNALQYACCIMCHVSLRYVSTNYIYIYYSVSCYTLALLLRLENAIAVYARRVMCLWSHLFEKANELQKKLVPINFPEIIISLL